jgi:hypothetical protein
MLGFDNIKRIIIGPKKEATTIKNSHLDVAFEARTCKLKNKVED